MQLTSPDFAVGGNGRHGQSRYQCDERRYGNDDETLPLDSYKFELKFKSFK